MTEVNINTDPYSLTAIYKTNKIKSGAKHCWIKTSHSFWPKILLTFEIIPQSKLTLVVTYNQNNIMILENLKTMGSKETRNIR